MRRRDFVRAVVAATITPHVLWGQEGNRTSTMPAPGPVPWMQGITHANPKALTATSAESIARGELQFFTPVQMRTLNRLGDILMPSLDGYPAASQAGTPMFLDFLLSESSPVRQHVYSSGLDWLDAQANLHYRSPFDKVTEEQADALLRPWLRTWMTDHVPLEPHADFVNSVKYDVLEATQNSAAWREAELNAGKHAGEELFWTSVEPDIYRPLQSMTQLSYARKQLAR